MGEKVTTIMVLEVNLQCQSCYKKVKKVLCKIPQIQDQMYDEKKNLVMIKVVCCSPEKIKQKIICKGGDSIKSIEIKQPPKPKEPEKPKEKPADPPKPAEKPKEKPKDNPPKPAEKPKEPEKPKEKPADPAPKPAEKPADPPKPAEKPEEPAPAPAPAPKAPVFVPCYPVPAGYPIGTCCSSCYEGRGGGPCFHGHGAGGPPPYEGYGRPVYDSYGGGYYRPPCYLSRCDDYFSEENPSGCTII